MNFISIRKLLKIDKMKEETEGKDQRHREQGTRYKDKTRRKTGVEVMTGPGVELF